MSAEESMVQADVAQADEAGKVESTDTSLMAANDPFPEAVYGKRGDDGRPEKVPEKYWKDGNVEWPSVLEERNFLSSKLGAFKGAPKEGYELPEPEGLTGSWDKEDPMLQTFLDKCTKANASQEFVSEILDFYARSQAEGPEVIEQRKQQELAKIGNDAPKRIKDVNDFLFASLDLKQAQALAANMTTAEAFTALEKLVNKAKPHRLPRDGGPNPSGHTAEGLRAMRFKTDANGQSMYENSGEYRSQVDRAYKEFYGEE